VRRFGGGVSLIRPAWVPRPTPGSGPVPTGPTETVEEAGNARAQNGTQHDRRRTEEARDSQPDAGPSTSLPKSSPRSRRAQDASGNIAEDIAEPSGVTSAATNTKTGEPAKEDDTSMDDLTRSFDAVLEFVPRGVRKREKRKGEMDVVM
jgi:hypothetical protein